MTQIMDLDAEVFPGIAVEIIAARFELLALPDGSPISVVQRPLRAADPNWSCSVYPSTWSPVAGSYEMKGVDYSRDATLQQYVLLIQSMIKDADAERGVRTHSVFSETIRTILATDAPLRAQLGGLAATLDGSTKTLKRWWVRSGRYNSGSVGTNNIYLSINELILEVEKTS